MLRESKQDGRDGLERPLRPRPGEPGPSFSRFGCSGPFFVSCVFYNEIFRFYKNKTKQNKMPPGIVIRIRAQFGERWLFVILGLPTTEEHKVYIFVYSDLL